MKNFDKHKECNSGFHISPFVPVLPKKQFSSRTLGCVSPEKTVRCRDWCEPRSTAMRREQVPGRTGNSNLTLRVKPQTVLISDEEKKNCLFFLNTF